MADEKKRIINETTDEALASSGDYVIVDSQAEGTRKFDLGAALAAEVTARDAAIAAAVSAEATARSEADTEISGEVSQLSGDIGDLSDLETTEKTNLVAAINEANQHGGGGGGELTDELKEALLQIARKVTYIDEHGQDYYNDLYAALYAITVVNISNRSIQFDAISSTFQLTATTVPAGGDITWSTSDSSVATVSSTGLVTSTGYGSATITATSGNASASCSVLVAQATVVSINAAYTQARTVYDTSSLDILKQDLVVTANWSDSTTTTIPSTDYTLSGTLTVGTSTVTVSYGGKTATFNVTVTSGSEKTLTSISTVFAPGTNALHWTTPESTIRSYTTVTAHYSDDSTEVVTDYTLQKIEWSSSGTVEYRVNYGNVTYNSFSFTPDDLLYEWDFTDSLAETITGQVAQLASDGTNPVAHIGTNGLMFDAPTQIMTLFDVFDARDKTLEIDVESFAFAGDSNNHVRFLMMSFNDAAGMTPMSFRKGLGWSAYLFTDPSQTGKSYRNWYTNGWGSLYNTSQINAFDGKTVKFVFGADSKTLSLYLDDTLIATNDTMYFKSSSVSQKLQIGGLLSLSVSGGDQCYDMTISGIRIYKGGNV